MDFGTLLHTATKNEKLNKKEPSRCYSTKFEPPKKEQRDKKLSDNIKRFLAKKEAEEQRKKQEAMKKRGDLLALRSQDKKAVRRVNVMLKRTKSASQSVIEGEGDNVSATLASLAQPDEDDYGYVSQEAAALYNKMMERYNKEEVKINNLEKKKKASSANSFSTQVRTVPEREREQTSESSQRKRKHVMPEEREIYREEEVAPPPVKKKPPPPPINFNDLLKLAEKKQFEPIIIEQKPKEKERPLTKKQKKECEREKEYRDRKEGKLPPLETKGSSLPQDKPKGSKGNEPAKKVVTSKAPQVPQPPAQSSSSLQPKSGNKLSYDVKKMYLNRNEDLRRLNLSKSSDIKPYRREDDKRRDSGKVPIVSAKPSSVHPEPESSKQRALKISTKARETDVKRQIPQTSGVRGPPKQFPPADVQRHPARDHKQFPPTDTRGPKQFPPADVRGPKQFSPADGQRPKQFPPVDVRGAKRFPPKDVKRKPIINKGRIFDDDDDEYDSEMDDFIDDGPTGEEDYSKLISEIFNYDKKKYRYMDDDVDDMESSFVEQMKEESRSSRIGRMEDLDDMRKEEEEKKRKALMKKQQLKRRM